ncbi:MAG: translocator protein [Patescibacteria group bacterium]|nr:translocator protein [Patescibacteria group bacterium]
MNNKYFLLLIIILLAILCFLIFPKEANKNEQISFKIPNIFTQYMSAQDWEIEMNNEEINIKDGEIECNETPLTSSLGSGVYKKVINDRVYCVNMSSEGAAGSVYTKYYYHTLKDNDIISISVTIRATQCYNYDEPQATECITERESFNIDNFISNIIQ